MLAVDKEERCNKWMPKAKDYCGRLPHVTGDCASAEARKRHIRRTSAGKAARIAERQKFIDAYKLAMGCEDCGYREHPRALDFDHLPGTAKRANVANLVMHASWDAVVAEVLKCQILCSNHHRIRTFERSQGTGAEG